MSFSEAPAEISYQIASQLDRQDLQNLALVSQSFVAVAQSLLFHTITISERCTDTQCQNLLDCIETNPGLLQHIRGLDLTASSRTVRREGPTRGYTWILDLLCKPKSGVSLSEVNLRWSRFGYGEDGVEDTDALLLERNATEGYRLLYSGFITLLRTHSVSLKHLTLTLILFPIHILLLCPNLEHLRLLGCRVFDNHDHAIRGGAKLPELPTEIQDKPLRHLKHLIFAKGTYVGGFLSAPFGRLLSWVSALSTLEVHNENEMDDLTGRLTSFLGNKSTTIPPIKNLILQGIWYRLGLPSEKSFSALLDRFQPVEVLELRVLFTWQTYEGRGFLRKMYNSKKTQDQWAEVGSSLKNRPPLKALNIQIVVDSINCYGFGPDEPSEEEKAQKLNEMHTKLKGAEHHAARALQPIFSELIEGGVAVSLGLEWVHH